MDPEVRALHEAAVVIDGLEISKFGREVFHNMQKGGLTAVNCTAAVHENFRATIRNLGWWRRAFAENQDLILPVRATADILVAKAAGKTGIVLGFQNTCAVEDDLDLLAVFHELGVRVMQMAYMDANYAGQGCLERLDAGLTNFGLEMVAEMNRLGILIDLSHVGPRTTLDTIEASAKPVAFTHANPKSLCAHPRNKSDEAIKALARKGGVIGATIFPPFLPGGNRSTLADFVKVVDHLVDMVGIDHVAIGTDFTEGQPREFFDWLLVGKSKKGPAMALEHPLRLPPGIEDSSRFANLTEALWQGGYRGDDLRKILGGNWLGLFARAWNE